MRVAARPDISLLTGTTLSRPRASALAGGQTAHMPDSGLIIFVQPRCVASRRLMTLIDGRPDATKSEVLVIVAVVGEHGEAQRMAGSALGRCQLVHVRPSRLPRELLVSIPCAVMLAPGRRVRHAGSMSDDAAVARFIEACGDKRVRQWINGRAADLSGLADG